MGEKSKKSGEYGEDVVKKLFAQLGWKSMVYGEDIGCFHGQLHQTGDGPRKTHGVDFCFNYESPLVVSQQESTVISSKYVDSYSSLISSFKSHLKEIAYTLQCFPYSEYYTVNVSPRIEFKSLNGVIVWLSRNDDFKKSVYEEVESFRNSENLTYGPIFLIDNLRASFLYSIIKDMRITGQRDFAFVYQSTGGNITTVARKSYGQILPVEMLTSPIHFIKSTENGREILNIYCLFEYKESSFLRLIGLSRDLTEQWATKIVINFPNYDDFKKSNSVSKVKSMYDDRNLTEKINVKRFDIVTFRSLENKNE